MVVLLAEMAEPHVLQTRCRIVDYCLCAIGIAQMPVRAVDPRTEIFGIRPCGKHLRVVISFDDEMGGIRYELTRRGAHLAYVGEKAEGDVAFSDEITHAVVTIMRHRDWCYCKRTDGEFIERLDEESLVGGYFLLYEMIVLYSVM